MRQLLFLSALILSVGCSGVQVVKQANPNPFVAKTSFNIADVSYDGLQIDDKGEEAWIAQADNDEKKNWRENRGDAVKAYNERLLAEKGPFTINIAGQGGEAVTVRPTILSIEQGWFVGISAKPTVVRMKLQLLNGQGEVADEVILTSSVTANMYRPAFGQRLHTAAEELADKTLDYVRSRSKK